MDKRDTSIGMTGLGALSCATSALYLLPQMAQAGIVYVDNQPLGVNANSPVYTPVYWDVDGDGNNDFMLWRGFISGWSSTSALYLDTYDTFNTADLNGRGMVQSQGMNGDQIQKLPADQVVGATLASGYKWGGSQQAYRTVVSYMSTSSGSGANVGFDLAVGGFGAGNNFFGFRFENATGIHYGWAEINIDLGNPAGFTITRWGYEDVADAPIAVGAQANQHGASAVPVPVGGAPLLALTALGMGAAGIRELRARRRRKNKLQPKH